MKSVHGDLLVGASGHCEGIQSLSIKIFREDHFRGSVLSSFLPEWMASLCNLPTICQWTLSFTSEWTEFSHSLKRHTNVPWPRHNGRAGNLPSLMMPVWPRLEEVESRNPKEAHSCANLPSHISESLERRFFHFFKDDTVEPKHAFTINAQQPRLFPDRKSQSYFLKLPQPQNQS